jgi:hypothetical protein
LYFRQPAPQDFTSVFWDAVEKGPVRFPAHCVVEDWELSPGMARPKVEAWLRSKKIEISEVCTRPSRRPPSWYCPAGCKSPSTNTNACTPSMRGQQR